MLQAELRVTSGKQSGHVIALVTNQFLIGREEDCHLRPNSDLVSRHHCVFKLDDYALRVRDLGSTNGTFVNGDRLRGEVMLNSGDRVTIGKLEFEIAVGDEVAHQPAAVGASTSGDPTDSFELGDTPSPAATMEIPAYSGPNPDDVTAPAEPQDQPASLEETMAIQGDTMVSGQTPPPPAGYPQQPIGYAMPYPQQPYPYAQPYGMPMMGYPQQPMPYPQMGMYPQQPMPPQPQVPQPAQEAPPPQEPASSAPASSGDGLDVKLPNPLETGAKSPEAKSDKGGQGKSNEEATRDSAADIIKQYTQRRPTG